MSKSKIFTIEFMKTYEAVVKAETEDEAIKIALSEAEKDTFTDWEVQSILEEEED